MHSTQEVRVVLRSKARGEFVDDGRVYWAILVASAVSARRAVATRAWGIRDSVVKLSLNAELGDDPGRTSIYYLGKGFKFKT